MSTTLSAALMFIRTEVARLCEPTLHYTYIDGKSCLGDKNPATQENENPMTQTHIFTGEQAHNEFLEQFMDEVNNASASEDADPMMSTSNSHSGTSGFKLPLINKQKSLY